MNDEHLENAKRQFRFMMRAWGIHEGREEFEVGECRIVDVWLTRPGSDRRFLLACGVNAVKDFQRWHRRRGWTTLPDETTIPEPTIDPIEFADTVTHAQRTHRETGPFILRYLGNPANYRSKLFHRADKLRIIFSPWEPEATR